MSLPEYSELSAEEKDKLEHGVFNYAGALAINTARMVHVAQYGLNFAGKKVLDVGSGVGHLAQFFVRQGADVQCVDAREENIQELRRRYPGLKAIVGDAENSLSSLGMFDVVFCYGLLYHTENPFQVIRNLTSVCREMILLETCVADYAGAVVNFVPETSVANQALRSIGCRPSIAFVQTALAACGFGDIEIPNTQPDFEDFSWEKLNDGADWRDGHNLRQVFLARHFETIRS